MMAKATGEKKVVNKDPATTISELETLVFYSRLEENRKGGNCASVCSFSTKGLGAQMQATN